jgi:hypothetical protein
LAGIFTADGSWVFCDWRGLRLVPDFGHFDDGLIYAGNSPVKRALLYLRTSFSG